MLNVPMVSESMHNPVIVRRNYETLYRYLDEPATLFGHDPISATSGLRILYTFLAASTNMCSDGTSDITGIDLLLAIIASKPVRLLLCNPQAACTHEELFN